jgi:hypothetical protein
LDGRSIRAEGSEGTPGGGEAWSKVACLLHPEATSHFSSHLPGQIRTSHIAHRHLRPASPLRMQHRPERSATAEVGSEVLLDPPWDAVAERVSFDGVREELLHVMLHDGVEWRSVSSVTERRHGAIGQRRHRGMGDACTTASFDVI